MSKIKFISDTHFGHKAICKYRTQFNTPEEHDEFVFDSICSNVGPEDHLWILGDIAFTHEVVHYLERIKKYCKTLNLVLGNHDTDSPIRQEVMKRLVNIADTTHTLTKKGGHWISHYPIHPDELRGKFNIHGHVHNKSIAHPYKESKFDDRYINVCCENVNFIPISMQEIKQGWRGHNRERYRNSGDSK